MKPTIAVVIATLTLGLFAAAPASADPTATVKAHTTQRMKGR